VFDDGDADAVDAFAQAEEPGLGAEQGIVFCERQQIGGRGAQCLLGRS
jgi:hypothetical protein